MERDTEPPGGERGDGTTSEWLTGPATFSGRGAPDFGGGRGDMAAGHIVFGGDGGFGGAAAGSGAANGGGGGGYTGGDAGLTAVGDSSGFAGTSCIAAAADQTSFATGSTAGRVEFTRL